MDMMQTGLQREANDVRQVAPLVPAVDIWEDANGITLKADMPGVAKEHLDIGIDGDTLTVQGAVVLGESAKLQDIHAEVRAAQYKRSFILSRDLDMDKIGATLQNGVLHMHIPKLEQAKPRRIEVKVA